MQANFLSIFKKTLEIRYNTIILLSKQKNTTKQ